MSKLRQFNSDEVASLVQQWLGVFGKDRQGVNTKAYMWHVFSFDRFPASKGEHALREYRSQIGCEFVVLSNDRDEAYLTDERPAGRLDDRPFSDFYVFPPNLAWTMAFTHEEGWLGPYFAQHPCFRELNADNIAKVKKQQEIENARSRGWI